jgi:DNA-binding FadR family transcriptional regulator
LTGGATAPAGGERVPPRLRQPRLADMIAERFRAQIMDGALAPGERLPRQEALAQELGVSLVVVREALRMLEAQGLITVHRGKTGGATVRGPDRTALSAAIATAAGLARLPAGDIRATLIALDGWCAETAAAQPGRQALVTRLNASVDAQLSSAAAESEFRRECGRFHAEISRGCGLQTLRLLCDALDATARGLSPAGTRRCEEPGLAVEQVVSEHRQAVRSISGADGPAAAAAARHQPARRR